MSCRSEGHREGMPPVSMFEAAPEEVRMIPFHGAPPIMVAVSEVESTQRSAILGAARAPVMDRLGKRVRFLVRTLNSQDDWAFLHAAMQDEEGRPVDYSGTPLEVDAAQGVLSKDYAALLRRERGGWRVVAHAIGPTDVIWLDWPARYRAPPGILPR